MKRIVILGGVILLVAGTTHWLIMREGMKNLSVWVAHAFGNADGSTIEMHILVDLGMVRREEAAAKEAANYTDGWIMLHWDMRDASGASVPFTHIAWSPLIDNEKCKAVPEFFIKYVLQKGGQYTITYTPRAKRQPNVKYRFAFKAPSEAQGMQRVLFEQAGS